jgi:hypothetical protein
MYTAYALTEKSRKVLYMLYPPKYPDFLGHHITEKFGVPSNTPVPEEPTLVELVGYIDNGEGVEGFLVEIDGLRDRPDGGKYHLTWSINRKKGFKPVHTNNYVLESKPISPVRIEVEPKLLK